MIISDNNTANDISTYGATVTNTTTFSNNNACTIINITVFTKIKSRFFDFTQNTGFLKSWKFGILRLKSRIS